MLKQLSPPNGKISRDRHVIFPFRRKLLYEWHESKYSEKQSCILLSTIPEFVWTEESNENPK
jgi:hypothetical protein